MLTRITPARVLAAALLAAATAQTPPSVLKPDAAIPCDACAGWNADIEPARLFGSTYFVGTAGLSAVLVTSDQGHILLDAGLPQSAPLIDAHIRRLGLRTEDIKLILTSHGHYDHVGGVAALQRFTGAMVAASASTAAALRLGGPTPDDPQAAIPRSEFPPVARVRIVSDGEVLRLGPLSVTAHLTPGHTPGSTAWTWQSCEVGRCLSMVYADSLNAVSADGFRFSGDKTSPSRADAFYRSIDRVAALECDVLVSVHPSASGLDRKLARSSARGSLNPFVDAGACRAYAAAARKTLDERLAKERESKRENR